MTSVISFAPPYLGMNQHHEENLQHQQQQQPQQQQSEQQFNPNVSSVTKPSISYQLYMNSNTPSTPTGMPQDTLISMLTTKSANIAPNKLWSFLKKVKLSRSVADLSNFADGYLIAEIIHLYAPLLITFVDLPMLAASQKENPDDCLIWNFLALTALKQLCIQLTEETITSFKEGDMAQVSEFFIILFQQIDQHARIYKSFNSLTRTVIQDHYQILNQIRFSSATPAEEKSSDSGQTIFYPTNWRSWSKGGRTVIRLSNVDYQTTKMDVQKFLYPLIVHQDAIHAPVHLSSGKMMYTIYVVFDDTVLPLRAVDLHSGHTLRSRRVEIKLVTQDDLFTSFYNRGLNLGHSDQRQMPPVQQAHQGEWVSEETKDRLLALCSMGKNCFSAKTPERPFEHAESFLALVPLDYILLTNHESQRLFDIACGVSIALLTFMHHQGFQNQFHHDLLDRIIRASLKLPFHADQMDFLQSIHEAHRSGEAHTFLSKILASNPANHTDSYCYNGSFGNPAFALSHSSHYDQSPTNLPSSSHALQTPSLFYQPDYLGTVTEHHMMNRVSSPMGSNTSAADISVMDRFIPNTTFESSPLGKQHHHQFNGGTEPNVWQTTTTTTTPKHKNVFASGMSTLLSRRRLAASKLAGSNNNLNINVSAHQQLNSAQSQNPSPMLARPYMSTVEQAFYAATPLSASFPRFNTTTNVTASSSSSLAVDHPHPPKSVSPKTTTPLINSPTVSDGSQSQTIVGGSLPLDSGTSSLMSSSNGSSRIGTHSAASPELVQQQFDTGVMEHVLGRNLWQAL